MNTVIFDFDGTIADSFEVMLSLFYELTGHSRFTDARVDEFRRMASLRQVAKEVNLSPRQIPMLVVKGRSQMRKHLPEIKPFDGMEVVLRGLHDDGYRLFVISSNSRRNVQTFFREHQLAEYFDGIYGGVGLFSKAGAIRKVMRLNKLEPQNCFYVGDEVRDILAGRQAHVRSVAVTWGYNHESILRAEEPYAIAKNPEDLLKVLS